MGTSAVQSPDRAATRDRFTHLLRPLHPSSALHLARKSGNTSLRQEKYDPTTTMEDHEKRMRNLLKKVHDLGGTATDAQFCRIVISSMPIGWKQDVRSDPGTTSAEAFTYLHTLWYEKEEEHREEERDTKHVKALMAAHSQTPTSIQPNSNPSRTSNRTAIICHNCSKPGHIARKCWAKGGGMEGQWPKQAQTNKPRTGANASVAELDDTSTSSPMATYVMLAQPRMNHGTSTPAQQPKSNTDPAARQNYPILKGAGQQDTRREGVDSDLHSHTIVTKGQCFTCHGTSSLYSPAVPAIKTFLDSGASEHCWVRKSDFVEYTRVHGQGGSSAIAGEGGKFDIQGTGTVQFVTRNGESERTIQLQGVKHTPAFGHNLVSLSTLDRQGMRGEWGEGVMTVKALSSETILEGFGRNKMYEVEILESGRTTVSYSRT